MAKDPAVLFYTSDFISGTLTMTDEQRGQYIMLLCLQHQKGYLTEKDMLNICKTHDEDIWQKFVKEDNKYFNIRMKSEIEKRKKYSESRSQNRKGKKKGKEHMNNISKTYDKHMENENENEDIIKNIDKNKDVFENFRQKYPGTKRGLETEFEYFKKHKDWKSVIESLPEIIDKQIAYRSVRKNRGEFVPEWKNLKTWIYNRCWEEEIEEVKPKSRFQE